MKTRTRSEVYDRLYVLASKMLDRYQPCQRCPTPCAYFGGKRSGCCTGCPFAGPTGCTVQSLGCKFWLCGEAEWYASSHLLARLRLLRRIARKYNVDYARATKDEVLQLTEERDVWFLYNLLNRGPYATNVYTLRR